MAGAMAALGERVAVDGVHLHSDRLFAAGDHAGELLDVAEEFSAWRERVAALADAARAEGLEF